MKDLTKGSPMRLIIAFALPILLGSLFQQAYSFTDIIIIGQNLGENSISAVGATTSIVSLMFSTVNGLVTGFSVVVAKCFGAGDHDEMRRAIARTITFSAVITAAIIAGITCFMTPLLQALNTPEIIIGEARDYLLVVTLGLVVTLMYNLESSILRAVGDSVVPLVILVISAALNILLDLLFVCVFRWGVMGAAGATVLAQLISAAVCLVYLIRRRKFLLVKRSDFRFDRHEAGEMLSAGLGMALMYSIVDIGSVVLQNGINSCGGAELTDEQVIAAHTAARKILSLLLMPFSAVGATLVTFCGQNRGAGKYSRIKIGIRDGLAISFIWSTLAIALIYLAGGFLVRLILPDAAQAVADTSYRYLSINVLFFYPLAVLLGVRSSLQGLGKSIVPIIASIMELSCKVVTVLVMIPWLGYFGVIISEPIIWTACGIFVGIIALITLRRMPKDDLTT